MTSKLITSSKAIALLLATIASGATVATAQSKVASVTREGDHTVIRCTNGSTLKVYHKRNGKCEMQSNWQEWDCSFAIRDRMKQCG